MLMKYATFDFECEWKRDTIVPDFQGSMLRGALGHALKSCLCTVKAPTCKECMVKNSCLYSKIFEVKPVSKEPIRQAQIPHPYMMCWDYEKRGKYRAGSSYNFSLGLFGEYIQMLPYFVFAIDRMGKTGLGARDANGERSRFSLKNVSSDGKVIFQEKNPVLPQEIPFNRLAMNVSSDIEITSHLEVTFKTPLRIKSKGTFVKGLDFQRFFLTILRRLDPLWIVYTENKLDIPNEKELVQNSANIEVARDNLQWTEQTRYSNRQHSEMQMGGLTGTIEFKGDLTPYIPLLRLAEQVHIGKSTSFGLGKFEIKTKE